MQHTIDVITSTFWACKNRMEWVKIITYKISLNRIFKLDTHPQLTIPTGLERTFFLLGAIARVQGVAKVHNIKLLVLGSDLSFSLHAILPQDPALGLGPVL